MTRPSIAVIGAGLIGQRHERLVEEQARQAAVVDPATEAQHLEHEKSVPCAPDLAAYLDRHRPDGVIIATPNQLHRDNGLACINAGIPILVEKPIADTTAAAHDLITAAKSAGVPVLVGHHRRHNPIIAAAHSAITAGDLGRIVSVHAQFWLYKPDDYFDTDWRRQAGAGPVFINLIHDIDLLRYLCGEIITVQARQSSATREHNVEDTAVILLEFASGALGTVNVSDTITAPWSWEMTAAENPAYPVTRMDCYRIGGTHGSLSIPDMALWQHSGSRSWWSPIAAQTIFCDEGDPLKRQLDHFCDVIQGAATPLVSGEQGLATLQVIEAIKTAARTGQTVRLPGF